MGILASVRNFVFQKSDDEYYYDELDSYEDEYEQDDSDRASGDVPYIASRRRETGRTAEHSSGDTIAITRSTSSKSSEAGQVFTMPSMKSQQVVISSPADIDDASVVCDYLKQHKTVVVNMETIEIAEGQRIMDFLGGVVYAIKGDIQKISNRIYIVAPENVEISEHYKEQLKAQGIFSGFKTAFGGR